jgi:RNA methyltransferase, TrmH family
MITLKKLASLKPRTRTRKTAAVFHLFARDIRQNKDVDINFLDQLVSMLIENKNTEEDLKKRITNGYEAVKTGKDPARSLDSLHYLLMESLGESPADWDLEYRTGPGASAEIIRKGFRLYLDDIRSPFNIGSIFRTADSFSVSRILLSPDCPSPDHPRSLRTAMGCTSVIPWEICSIDDLKVQKNGPLFALETGGTAIGCFRFPETGTLIIGSEEAGISKAARKAAEESAGIVSIPTHGSKGSLNLSVATGIALFHWDDAV